MKNLGYYNGHYDEIENMVIPMNDRAHYFGDGVYDATYSRNYIIWNLQEHLDRLYNSARLLEIEPPCPKEEMAEILKEMVRKVDDGNQFVYWQDPRHRRPEPRLPQGCQVQPVDHAAPPECVR